MAYRWFVPWRGTLSSMNHISHSVGRIIWALQGFPWHAGIGFERWRQPLAAAVAIVGLACGFAAATDSEREAPPAADARSLQGDFSRAKSPDERRAIVEALLKLGENGGRRLHGAARGVFLKQLPRYSAAFQQACATAVTRRFDKGYPSAEIESLRATIRDLAVTAELTSSMIEQKGDPALARLEAMLVFTPAQVHEADPDLAAARAELMKLADWAERAAELVPQKDRGKLPPMPGKADVATELDAAEALAALATSPISPADQQTFQANRKLLAQLDPEEARGIQRLNQIRFLVGLPMQAIDLKLVAACRVHSEDMATQGFFGHDSPVPGRESPWKRAAAAGTSANAENIFGGRADGESAIGGWWHSPGHFKNLLGGQRRTGIGRSGEQWTQLFGD